jgi:hypothetical protein
MTRFSTMQRKTGAKEGWDKPAVHRAYRKDGIEKDGCSLIGSSAGKFSIHLREDGLKKRERQVTQQPGSLLDSSRGCMRIGLDSQDQAAAVQMGSRGKFGGPSRTSDESSGS